MTRSVTILGATGSVGTSTVDLVARDPGRFRVEAVTAHRDVTMVGTVAKRVGARLAVIGDAAMLPELKDILAGTGIEAAGGPEAIVAAAARPVDWTMAAIVGCAGLPSVMAVLERGGTLALANKESLVSAGALMTDVARRTGATILPVDSEHNAIFQCLEPDNIDRVRRIVLTASGGPFRTRTLDQMRDITPEQAVRHPNWSMGAKISVDSATMMNKGLELIEAHHLFPVGHEKLAVVVHPQSIIHSMVDYVDGSTLAQLGDADMRVPIAHALAWPERMATPCRPLDLATIGTLTFEAPDEVRFPALALARAALAEGGARPAILNAANERAVAAFLDHRIGFLDIAAIVRQVLDSYDPPAPASLDDVFAVDAVARIRADEAMEHATA